VEPRKIVAALATVPTDLHDSYTDVFRRIEEKGADCKTLVRKILSWIYYTPHPLLMAELRHAIAIDEGDTDINEDYFLDGPSIIEICESLLSFDKLSGMVTYSHFTVYQFLQRDSTHLLLAPCDLAKVCLTYLNFAQFDTGPVWDTQSAVRQMRDYPFAFHAARCWLHYSQENIENDNELWKHFLRLSGSVPRILSMFQMAAMNGAVVRLLPSAPNVLLRFCHPWIPVGFYHPQNSYLARIYLVLLYALEGGDVSDNRKLEAWIRKIRDKTPGARVYTIEGLLKGKIALVIATDPLSTQALKFMVPLGNGNN
jgi:hypothetical protein